MVVAGAAKSNLEGRAPAQLTDVLAQVWATTSMPVSERRRLCHRMASQAMGAVARPDTDGGTLTLLEDVLATASELAGTRVNVATAKHQLRMQGRPDLASRLARVSKGRNAAAHPDVALAMDVRRALCGTGLSAAASGAPMIAAIDHEELSEAERSFCPDVGDAPPVSKGHRRRRRRAGGSATGDNRSYGESAPDSATVGGNAQLHVSSDVDSVKDTIASTGPDVAARDDGLNIVFSGKHRADRAGDSGPGVAVGDGCQITEDKHMAMDVGSSDVGDPHSHQDHAAFQKLMAEARKLEVAWSALATSLGVDMGPSIMN